MSTSIVDAAEAHTNSYAQAMESATKVTLTECADALSSHYCDGFMTFCFGQKFTFREAEESASSRVASHLRRFEAAGLGYDIFKVKHEISVVSQSSALCAITWEIRPQKDSGIAEWQWMNVYAFRRPIRGDGKGFWEFVLSDNEFGELTKRVPNFMEL